MIDFDSIPSSTDSPHFKFTFDAGKDNPFLAEKIDRRNNLAGRLEKLINEPTIGGHPVIRYALQNVSEIDPNELRTVGKAFERLADLWIPFQKIDAEVRGLTFARANPSLVALAFGSFDIPSDAGGILNPVDHSDESAETN